MFQKVYKKKYFSLVKIYDKTLEIPDSYVKKVCFCKFKTNKKENIILFCEVNFCYQSDQNKDMLRTKIFLWDWLHDDCMIKSSLAILEIINLIIFEYWLIGWGYFSRKQMLSEIDTNTH